MNRRTRPSIPHPFHKYLKPGALARIRDSRISARSHRLNSLLRHQISLHRPPSPSPLPDSNQPQATATAADTGFPFFLARIYGPRCPQRKKLMAAKSILFVPVNPAADSPDLVIDDLLVVN
ncbi:hypothetical protein AAZX31_13G291000 [Glycine max]|uniref:Uncharacterized protein n=2 Tax=Glycine subgen. Soja TaxID=1462606 RepID=I1M444_SOYBN|nr:uncharacterized protein LOC102662688 [Glycine max]XP_028188940.1 uncharacterized protein LOC114375364 [Glycine soja]KAG4961094.1 hypothetical protein JHK87_037727 [Glycine soja]KAG4978499.1 hypothetical protein JHK86_037973 [Glycine max]KAG5114509.1 hypothetical protein JHK82_037778 [Glycine max]KAG5131792.1 hypothetical protein JHK84_038189 [Glycine max]KAH1104226.1 hypothetical protein GYH30_037900 [Glycine max]|eukprot:XP_006594900.1 uncharacterized protein LOC102662688 [Glycine max]